jgi:hypothetical protein
VNDIKVGYLGRDGYRSTAYIDENTGLGMEKHSGVPVRLHFDEEAGGWLQVDTWEWVWNPRTEMPEQVGTPAQAAPPVIRRGREQPRRRSRAQRRKGQ